VRSRVNLLVRGPFVAVALALLLGAAGAMSQPAAPGKAGAAAGSAAAPAASTGPAAGAPAAAGTAAASGGVAVLLKRKSVSALPAPTPAQLAALRELQKEADRYERDAKDYRATLTRVIKHHYEERRRRILSALDVEIATESKALDAARAEAIRRLETFVARYSPPNAHPQSTPDAMFRLAALYEERARALAAPDEKAPKGAAPAQADLLPAITLYKRIINEFPQYRERAAVFYYLGHMLNDMGRLGEAQQVWRSLVCQNRYPYPVAPDPKDPTKDSVASLPQDHPPDWWLGWMQRHPEPLDLARNKKKPGAGAKRGPAPKKEEAAASSDEESFVTPYPEDCQPIAQQTAPGEDPRYVAEIWWQIGDYHFAEIDPSGGPYNYNRAESAYRHSLAYKTPPLYGVAMYKLAWTYYNQQRYSTAVKQFVELLNYTDEQEKLTGNRGEGFRNEAYAYIAASTTYADFEGPTDADPYVAREDIFDTIEDPAVVEQKMHVALDRIQNPELIPQNKKWTVEVYKALGNEFKEYNHYRNLVEVSEIVLQKWPLHRDAPVVQNQIAEVYETIANQTQKGSAEHEGAVAKALEARSKLTAYVAVPGKPTPAWVEANKEDPEAVMTAERLVRSGLRRAAADHTNAGAALVAEALKIEERKERDPKFEQALGEYDKAEATWAAYLSQDENADDAYESRYWLADARTNKVVIQVALHRMPSDQDIADAQKTAREVRDSNEDNKYLQPAGLMVVNVAFQRCLGNYYAFDDSKGSQGFERRTKLKEEGEGEESKFVAEPVPAEVEKLVTAWDEYVQTVPLEVDPYNNQEQFLFSAGETYFLYGQFDQARKRLYPIYQAQCGKTKFGYLAWERLLTMANKEKKTEEGRQLAEAAATRSCAVNEEQKAKEPSLRDPTIKLGYYADAAKAFEEADKAPNGPARRQLWLKAAALYQAALEKAPDHDEAPEAAINGAIAYKQVGEYDKAIAMYKLFIDAYGNEDKLKKLKEGDPEAKEPRARKPDPKRYEERMSYLKRAYQELAASNVQFFDYRAAAETYEAIAKKDRFDDETRREAARNAVWLYAGIGEQDKLKSARATFFTLNPTAEQRAEVDWFVASADLKRWDERGQDRGENRAVRLSAMDAMDRFHRANQANNAAARYVVQAAYNASKLRRVGGDPGHRDWCKNATKAFEVFKRNAEVVDGKSKALATLEADMAAECAFRELDEQIAREFDYDSGKHRYQGVITDVVKTFKKDVEEDANKKWFPALDAVVKDYGSPRWAVAARARQGSLYDSCRTGLYNAREPGLKLFNDKEEAKLKTLDQLCEQQGSDQACAGADTFRAKRRADWRQTREESLVAADKAMVAGYAQAIVWARAWKVRNDAVDKAVRRLAFFTDVLGDAKLREYSTGVDDPASKQAFDYSDGMFLQMRRGLNIEPPPEVLPSPIPSRVQ
jgi:tetratricopeptide (TPR) repeat protein